MNAPTALIAEDEPLLAEALRAELARLWPDLRIVAVVGDGLSAVTESLRLQPDILFFDIRMPGQSGLEAATELADAWGSERPFPHLVFVTAYEQYALQAFEAQAVDYLLKPVQAERLGRTLDKLKARLVQPASGQAQLDAAMAQLRGLLAHGLEPAARTAPATTPQPLRMLQVSTSSVQGSAIRLIPVEDVLCFEAADKYVRVLTAHHEYLIRTPLKELQSQLDPERFWQIHRGTIVQATAIESVTRNDAGKTVAALRGLKETFIVSRLYSHLFKPM